MKAIQRIKKLVKRITSMTLRGRCGGYDRASEGRDPRDGGRARPRPEERYASDSSAFVLRHGILSLYSYIRKFVPWRSRTYIQNLRHVRIAGVTSSFLFGLLALAIIIPLYNVTGTEDTEAASSYVPSTSSITFTSTRNKASINLTPTSTTGTFVQSDTTNTSEVASFNVTTNNATGYTLGIASSTDTTSLTNGTDTLPTITNASTGITAATFNTSTYNDMWGYLPSKYNSTSNTGSSAKFYSITTTTATLDETTAANSTANTYTIALGARVTMTKSSGTYTTPSGTAFVLTAVGKPASYSITYNQNTTDSVSNLPGPTGVQSTSAQSINLSSAIPTRTNYNFLGWCSASTSDLASGADASSACATAGGTYYAGGTTNTTFYIDETTPNVTTLYAIWELAGYTITFATSNATGIVFNGTTYTNGQSVVIPISEAGTYSIYGTYATKYAWQSWSATAGSFGNQSYQNTTYTVTGNATITLTGQSVTLAMQNLSTSNCTTTARPVYDTRDNSVYWVQKLADDKCWMLDNLALDLTNSTIVNSLSTGNTNLDTTALSYFKNGGGSTDDRYPTAAYANGTFGTIYSQPKINASNKDKVLVSMDAPTTPNHKKGAYGPGQNKWGAYYNYCAASVGYYCYGNDTSAGTSSGDNSYDVCPAGWRMPTGNTNGEYDTLYKTSAINSNAANLRNALSTPLSGYINRGFVRDQGSIGNFWSSTWSANDSMYTLYVYALGVFTTNRSSRGDGNSVRCVLKLIMQSIAVSDLAEGEEKIAIDARDGKDYTIKKINGYLWMTQNLRFTGTSVLSSTSNVTSDKTLTYYSLNSSDAGSFGAYSDHCDATNGYNYACIYDSGSTTTGVWYNYFAASAGTISTNSNSTEASRDICPKGWHIPKGKPNTSGTEWYKLFNSTSTGWIPANSYLTAFGAVAGGDYGNGSFYGTGVGDWWSATASSTTSHYRLNYDSSDSTFGGNYGSYRYCGLFVRCVRTS